MNPEQTDITLKASVDIGNNLTQLLEKLAHQIGVTADKIFPWYVQQVQIEGWTSIALFVLFLSIGLVLILIGCAWGKFGEHDEAPNKAWVAGLIGAIMSAITLFGMAIDMKNEITKVMNPQYHAVKSITCDLARLKP